MFLLVIHTYTCAQIHVCTCIHNTYIGQTHIHTSPCWVHFVVSLCPGSNQTTLHWTTNKRTRPWKRLLVALPAVTRRCLCLGVNLQMSLLPHQYAHRYCRSPGLSMRISKRDCFPADSLVLWATRFPSLSKKEILCFSVTMPSSISEKCGDCFLPPPFLLILHIQHTLPGHE